MSELQTAPTCPGCGKALEPGALVCPACGQELVRQHPQDLIRERPAENEERPRRRRRRDEEEDYPLEGQRRRDITNAADEEALSWIVPLRESLWAIAAGYLGLFACFPLVGLLPALLAVPIGILALRDIKRNPRRRGAFRAWVGIVLGSLMILLWGLTLVLMAFSNQK